MGRVPRNAPCPCGSGKKYKHCHLRADEAAKPPPLVPKPAKAPDSAAPPIGTPEVPAEQVDTEAADETDETGEEEGDESSTTEPAPGIDPALESAWKAFEAADWEQQLAMTAEAIGNPAMDHEECFARFDSLYTGGKQDNQRMERVYALLQRLRSERPDAYEPDQCYYLWWQLDDCLRKDDLSAARRLVQDLASQAAHGIDTFSHFYPAALYHDFRDELIAGMSAALEGVRTEGDILPWAVEEFESRLFSLIVSRHIDMSPNPGIADQALRDALKPLPTPKEDVLADALQRLTRPSPPWPLDALNPKGKKRQAFLANLHSFFHDFEHFARQKGVTALRVLFAREHLQDYMAGRSEKCKSLSYLRPERESLNSYLAHTGDFISSNPYAALGTMLMLPLYLDFLVAQKALDVKGRENVLSDLAPLSVDVRGFVRSMPIAPSPLADFDAAWPSQAMNARK